MIDQNTPALASGTSTDELAATTGSTRSVDALFAEALERPEPERAALLAACPDPDVRREVASLLRAHGEAADFMAVSDVDPLLGTTVGPWRLARELGAGGMGRVYLGRREDGRFDQEVAIKVIRRGMDTDDVLRRFDRERSVLASLDHPGIARLFDGGATGDDRPWIAMEYVRNGQPIDAWCDARRLGIRQRVELFRQVCGAVQAAHQSLVVHRDLKPGNLLVTPEGQVKLVDFGIARVLEGDAPLASAVTTAGAARFLTPGYASPEQLAGKPVTTASDVYALGIVLYRLLTGQLPWDDVQARDRSTRPCRLTTRLRTLSAQELADEAARRLTTPTGWRRQLRGDLEQVVMKAMADAPEDRYPSAAAFAADLERALAHEPTEAGPGGIAYVTRKAVQRHPIATAMALAVGIIVASGFVVVSTSLMAVRQAHASEQAALAAEQEALAAAESEAKTVLAVNSYLMDLLTSADPYRDSAAFEAGRDTTVIEVLDRHEAALDGGTIEDPKVEAVVRQTIGRTYAALGATEQAETHLRRAIALDSAHRGPEHEFTLLSKFLLGNQRQRLGDLDGAASLYQEVLAGRMRLFGDDHEATVAAKSNLAVCRWHQGRLEEALPLAEGVLAWRRDNLDPTHRTVLQSLSNLGLILNGLGRLDEAEQLFREEVDVSRSVFPDDHPQLMTAIGNLAYNLHAQGRLEEAANLFEQTLAGSRSSLGDDHEQTLLAMSNLGVVYDRLGRLDEACALLEESYATQAAKYGPTHARLGVVSANLGNLYRRTGQLDRALEFNQRSVEIHEARYGPDFFRTAIVRRGYGETLAALGRYAEARAALEASVRVLTETRGADFVHTQRSVEALEALTALEALDDRESSTDGSG